MLVGIGSCAGTGAVTAPSTAAPPQRAAHGAHIEITALTDDGRRGVTQDALGGTRLWPTLDGSLEPIVVHAAPARELAIGRDGMRS